LKISVIFLKAIQKSEKYYLIALITTKYQDTKNFKNKAGQSEQQTEQVELKKLYKLSLLLFFYYLLSYLITLKNS